MIRRHGHGPGPSAGFTLVELILVLFLMGLAVSAVASGSPRLSDTLRLRQAGRQAASMLKTVRSLAVIRGIEIRCVYDPEEGNLRAEDDDGRVLKEASLPDGVDLELIRRRGRGPDAETRRVPDGPLDIARFFPDGSSSSGVFAFSRGQRQLFLVMEPLFGEARLAETL